MKNDNEKFLFGNSGWQWEVLSPVIWQAPPHFSRMEIYGSN